MDANQVTSEAKQAAREYAREWLDEKGGWASDEAFFRSIPGALEDLEAAFERFATAAVEAERERIVGICNKTIGEIENRIDDENCSIRDEESLQEQQCGIRRVRDAISVSVSVPPPVDAPLTAEAVKRMLPANCQSKRRGFYHNGPLAIEWKEDGQGFYLEICREDVPLSAFTESRFRNLIDAFGLEPAHG